MPDPMWQDVGGGHLGILWLGADGNPVTLLKEVWEFKGFKHTNLDQNWDAFIETIIRADGVFESRRQPENRIYVKQHANIVREDGRTAPGVLMVVVNRQRDCVVSAYVPDYYLGKIGKRLWP